MAMENSIDDRVEHRLLLLALAWAIELLAVGINLTIAVLSTLQAFSDDKIQAVMAGIPFVVVAFAEFSKIPFALTAVRVGWGLRPLLLLITLGMGGITLFTLVGGFERTFTYQ